MTYDDLTEEQKLIYLMLDNSKRESAIRISNWDNPRNAATANLWLANNP